MTRGERHLTWLFLLILAAGAFAARMNAQGRPMRVVIMVDSSQNVAPALNSFRAGLNSFIDTLPQDAEAMMITSGGQMSIKSQPSTDREKLRAAANSFAAVGGANTMVETLLEADRRFLKPAKDRWPVFVILTSDNGESVSESRIDEYNKFARDFQSRGGVAHVIMLKGRITGAGTDVAMHLTGNTGGTYKPIAVANAVPDLMKSIGETIAKEYAAHHPK